MPRKLVFQRSAMVWHCAGFITPLTTANLLGIDADRRIHVATRAKSIETTHLQTGLLKFEGGSLTHVPTSKQMHPDGDRLAEHFEDFLSAEAHTTR